MEEITPWFAVHRVVRSGTREPWRLKLRPLFKLVIAASFCLSGCVDGPNGESELAASATFADALSNATTSARPARQGTYGALSQSGSLGAQVYPAERTDPAGTTASDSASYNGRTDDRLADASGSIVAMRSGYQLNFENAEIGSVGKAILGDILHANYSIDPRVQGQISLTSSQPVARKNLIPLLERSLSSVGASIVKDADLYRIVPTGDTGGISTVDYHGAGEGFGTTVIEAKYVPAQTVARMLESLGSKAGSVRVEPGSNLVMVQGSAAERRSALEASSVIDVDWLRSKSVAILPVANATPEAVITELNRILDTGEGGLSQNIVQLQPIARLNAVLAVSRRKDAIDLVTKWMGRLDRADYGSASVKVYRLQYAQAKTAAAMLNDMFGGRTADGSGTSGDTTTTAPAKTDTPAGGTTGAPQQNASSSPMTFGALKAAFVDPGKSSSATDAGLGASTSSQSAGDGKRPHVTADLSSNSLYITATPRDYKMVEAAIRQMDRAPLQVNISVTIAEVKLTRDLQFGVQVFLHSRRASAGFSNNNAGSSLIQSHPGLNLLVGAFSDPKLLLSALQSITDVKVLSSPSLVVIDRQAAVLQVGDQVPILTRSQVSETALSTVNSVDYRDTGIILNVLPRINANGIVSLDVEQQISSVSNADTATLTPTISQRRVRSSIAVNNGQTVMLAGLINEKTDNTKSGLPGLSQIRFIGDLLGAHQSTNERTELLIFIKPEIITNGADAEQVSEEFRARMQSLRPAMTPVVTRY